MLRAGAVGGTGIGGETIRRLRFMAAFGMIGRCAVVGTTLGTGAVPALVLVLAIDRVTRISSGMVLVSTLGTDCTLGDGCISGSGVEVSLALLIVSDIRCRLRSSCVASNVVMPLINVAQSASAAMSLSCGVTVGLVMFLCWN